MTGLPISYQWRGGAMLRASTDPGGLEPPPGLDLDAADGTVQGRAWLAQVWQRSAVRSAVEAASPSLGEQIGRIAGGAGDDRQVRRAVLSLASYLLRWQRRATPFAWFAGVAPVHIGPRAQVVWGQRHRGVPRADGAWLSGVTAALERNLPLLEQLEVMANNTAVARGGRVVVPGVPVGGDALLMPPIEVSVRRTAPVACALDLARVPIRYQDLRKAMAQRFPEASAAQLDTVLTGLVEQQLLVSSLWAPMTIPDGLGHLCEALTSASAGDLPEIAPVLDELEAIHNELAQAPASPPALLARMRAVHDSAPVPLMVDTALDASVRIPAQVVREAAGAASVLVRLSPFPFGYPQWRDYHNRFRERYGVGALVPVLDLVADSGLGLPADYLGAARRRAPRTVTDRDATLLALVQQTTLDGSGEIHLTDALVAELEMGGDEILPPARVEVCVEVRAATLDALDRGDFQLAVTGAPRPGSSMAGRFAHLLSREERQEWSRGFQAPEAAAVQLSFGPRRRRDENVVRTEQLLPEVIPLAEYRAADGAAIALDDLAVTADARRLFLVRLSTGRHLEPRVLHALEAGRHTPPLARFLAELTTARASVYKGFDFGSAARMPYLPAVRYRRTLLAPARWLLHAADLPGRGTPMPDWERAWDSWRSRWKLPEHVALIEAEQRLPLNLAHPLHRQLLRSRLEAAGRMELRQAPDPKAFGWLGRPHEILIPLHHEPAQPTAPSTPTAALRAVTVDAAQLPGTSEILYAQLWGHAARWDEILTERLQVLLDSATPQLWWFQRYRDTARPDADQRLDLFLQLARADDYGRAARTVGAWAARLRDQHLLAQLSLATYQPQTGRYGHDAAMDAAHSVFAADSAAALAQIRTCALAAVPPQAVAAASTVDLAARYAASPADGMRQLAALLPRQFGHLDPVLRDHALTLSRPDGPSPALLALPAGDAVAAAWQHRATALTRYRSQLADQRDPATVLRSLLHLHHIRAVGADPETERTTERLARTCALRPTPRSGR